jgi:hypothetical protein
VFSFLNAPAAGNGSDSGASRGDRALFVLVAVIRATFAAGIQGSMRYEVHVRPTVGSWRSAARGGA